MSSSYQWQKFVCACLFLLQHYRGYISELPIGSNEVKLAQLSYASQCVEAALLSLRFLKIAELYLYVDSRIIEQNGEIINKQRSTAYLSKTERGFKNNSLLCHQRNAPKKDQFKNPSSIRLRSLEIRGNISNTNSSLLILSHSDSRIKALLKSGPSAT